MKSSYIIDAHAHIGYWPNLNDCQQTLLDSTKAHNISFTLVSFDGTEFQDENNKRIRLISQLIGFNKAYEFTCKNKKFGMILWIRPNTESNILEVENFINSHRNDIYGIGIHPFTSRIKVIDEKLFPYYKLAEKYALPILVHTAVDKYSSIKNLEIVAKEWPNLNFIAAHLELYSKHKEALRVLKQNNNIFGDTAWVDMDVIKELRDNDLMDKIMFGTDNPIDGIKTLDNPLYKKYFDNAIKLDQCDYDKLMYLNALRIYKIPEKLLK
ncbi:MAG: amidohydrolase family protein [Bacilli bacterium]